MPQHRSALAGLLRPRLKPPGFSDSAFLRQLDQWFGSAGVPVDDAAPAAAPAPAIAIIPRSLSSPTAFFRSLKDTKLFPSISQAQVDGINFKLAAFGRAGWPLSFAAYGFVTSYWETGRTMQPCREKGSGDGPDADKWDDYLERYDTGALAIRLGRVA